MKKFRAVVRSISPFTKGKTTSHADEVQSVTSEDIPLPDWDLSNVNFEVLLTHFYETYNPTRVSSIGAILEQYQNDEIIMLLQLAERYNLSQSEMKHFIEKSRQSASIPSAASGIANKHSSSNAAPSGDTAAATAPSSATATVPKQSVATRGEEKVEWRLPVRQRRPDSTANSTSTPMSTARSMPPSGDEENPFGSAKFSPKPIVSEPASSSTNVTSMSLQDIIRASRAASANAISAATRHSDKEEDEASSDGDESESDGIPVVVTKSPVKKTNGTTRSPKASAATMQGASSSASPAADDAIVSQLQSEITSLKEKLSTVETEKDELLSLLMLLVEDRHSSSAMDALEAYLVRKGLKQREQLGDTGANSTSSEDENDENDPTTHQQHQSTEERPQDSYEQFHYSYQPANTTPHTMYINETPLSRDKLRLHSLEGTYRPYNERSTSPSVRSLPAATSTSSYMLGTKASTSRVKDTARKGRSSGKFSPYRFTTSTTTPTNTRPMSASSRSSRASSSTNRSRARSASPAHSYNSDAISSTYRSAKKYLNHSTQQAQQSYVNNSTHLEEKSRQLAAEKQRAIASTNNSAFADPPEGWVTCFDPKSKQKYYYNAKLKKSVWKLPTTSTVETKSEPHFSWSPQADTIAPSISSVPAPSVASRSTTPSSRHSSPTKSVASATSKRSNSSLQVVAGVPWLMATDPKSERHELVHGRNRKASSYSNSY